MDELMQRFKDEICDKWSNWKFTDCHPDDHYNPLDDLNWYDMSFGWFMAQGLDPVEAEKYAVDARYDHQYWHKEAP